MWRLRTAVASLVLFGIAAFGFVVYLDESGWRDDSPPHRTLVLLDLPEDYEFFRMGMASGRLTVDDGCLYLREGGEAGKDVLLVFDEGDARWSPFSRQLEAYGNRFGVGDSVVAGGAPIADRAWVGHDEFFASMPYSHCDKSSAWHAASATSACEFARNSAYAERDPNNWQVRRACRD